MALTLKDSTLFRQQAFIDGKFVDADSGRTLNVINPSTNKVLGTVPACGAAETRRAIEAAQRAWPAWRSKTARERSNVSIRCVFSCSAAHPLCLISEFFFAQILRKFYELMVKHTADLATILHTEQGLIFVCVVCCVLT